VTLERLSTVAGSLPMIGNIMALIDAIMDMVQITQKTIAKKEVDFLQWVSLGINLIGVVPVPLAMSAARMSLRPVLHLVQQKLAPPQRRCSEEESAMTTIATRDLRMDDVPQGSFNWSTFSKFALTFDPLSEVTDEFDQAPASATPSDTWTEPPRLSWRPVSVSQAAMA